MILNEDYRDILLALSEEKVKFLLVGAHAIATYGYPRLTMDIDLWVEPSASNAEAVMRALVKFGSALQDLTLEDLQRDGTVFQMGVPPRRIDIMTGISGLVFGETYDNSLVKLIDGVEVRVPSMDDLIRNKLASGRGKDLDDVKALVAMKDKLARG